MTEIWDLWYPKAGSTGLPFGRGSVNRTNVMLVHAAPEILTVTVMDDKGAILAAGKDLKATAETPITKLIRKGNQIEREDIWPTRTELDCLVLLPGGEVGVLKQWWNAPDCREWRWQIELYNRKAA